MLRISLQNMTIENFKGIDKITIDIDGRNADVKGSNATGKTSIIDAFYWLISNKNSDLKTDFSIIPYDKMGIEKNVESKVSATFKVNDDIVRLKKVFKQRWSKIRGSIFKQLTGSTTKYFLNGDKTNQKNYNQYLSSIIDIDMFRLLTDINFFYSCNVEYRRNLITSICDNITFDEIVKKDASLKELSSISSGIHFDDFRKKYVRDQKEIMKKIDDINTRIDENKSNIVAIDEKTLIKTLDIKEAERKDILNRLQNLNTDAALIEKKKKLNQIELEMIQYEKKFRIESDENIRLISDQVKKLTNRISEYEAQSTRISATIKNIENDIIANDAMKADLLKQWQNINSNHYASCDYCGQKIPVDVIKSIKAKQLKSIDIKGNELREKNDLLHAELLTYYAELKSIKDDIEKEKQEIVRLEKEIHDQNNEATLKYANQQMEFTNEIELLTNEMSRLDYNDDKNNLLDQLKFIENDIKDISASIAIHEKNKTSKLKIEAYENNLKKLSEEYESIEKIINLIDVFNFKKSELIEQNVSDRFRITNWKLFEIQNNSNIKNVCMPIYNGVPFSDLNTGSKINCMIDIIETLSNNYSYELPILIDNAESITSWIDINRQVIRFYADENYNQLQINLYERNI